jgi:hypothetical protein
MAQFQSINPKVEVNGQTVLSIANGLGAMKSLGIRILGENGLTDIKPENWYPQQSWLNAFKIISEKVGVNTLYKIGTSIPYNAQFPPEINDISKALAAIDVAYHMNHRLNSKPLFDPSTGKMTEGIGHYHYSKISDNKVEIKCDNPYPCDFDRGIIEQMTKRFKLSSSIMVKVEHDGAKGCRKKGGNSCSYLVSW